MVRITTFMGHFVRLIRAAVWPIWSPSKESSHFVVTAVNPIR
jgi:hypothetical protein